MQQSIAGGGLTSRVAIVTGGGSGIGEEVVRTLERDGARAYVLDRVPAPHDARAARWKQADVTDPDAVSEAVGEVEGAEGGVDILVNCAGYNSFSAPEALDVEGWRRIVAVNLDGTYHACLAVIPGMMRRRSGRIVNIGSSASLLAIPHAVAYTAAKHAVVGLTRALALDLGPYGITVNCVCPGSTLTPLLAQAVSENFRAMMTERTPLRRLGLPSDIASAIAFLASPQAAWISGVALPVDGGMVAGSRSVHWE